MFGLPILPLDMTMVVGTVLLCVVGHICIVCCSDDCDDPIHMHEDPLQEGPNHPAYDAE